MYHIIYIKRLGAEARQKAAMRYITIPRQIAYPLRQRRKDLGMTQDDLARAAGVSRQLVNKAEAGLAPGIGFDRLLRMLDALGLSLAVISPNDAEAERIPAAQPVARQGGEYHEAFAAASALSSQAAALLGIAPRDGGEGDAAPLASSSRSVDGNAL